MSTRRQQQTETTVPTFAVPTNFMTDTNRYGLHPSRETHSAVAATGQERVAPTYRAMARASGNVDSRLNDRAPEHHRSNVHRLRHTDEPIRDSSGFAVFSDGELGAMHAAAHRMLDSDQMALGHRVLGAWLKGRHGTGSDWVHIQWHMAVFDLSLGHWQAAWRRFRQQILPSVITSDDALTDAPALLWRLSLQADRPLCLPWEAVRVRAISAMQKPQSPFARVHNLLALAGAGDLDNLDTWIRNQESRDVSSVEALVARIARALRAYVSGNYREAAAELTAVVPHVSQLGGSRAQNELFAQLRDAARRKAETEDGPMLHLQAA
jgi:hypothetical protein